MKEDGDEHHKAELGANEKGAGDRDAVEERVQQQSDECRRAGHGADAVSLFPEVKMRRDRMLREMNGEVPRQHQHGRDGAAAGKCFRQQLDNRDRQHEPRAERQQMLDDFQLQYGPARDGQGAEHVAGGGDESVQKSFRHGRVDTHAYCGPDPPIPRPANAAMSRRRPDRDVRQP